MFGSREYRAEDRPACPTDAVNRDRVHRVVNLELEQQQTAEHRYATRNQTHDHRLPEREDIRAGRDRNESPERPVKHRLHKALFARDNSCDEHRADNAGGRGNVCVEQNTGL